MEGRLILNLSENDHSFFLRNGTKLYYEKLRIAYKDILDGVERPYTYFAFVTLCSATLEASLNFLIIDYYLNKYGPIRYKQYCESYMGLPFKNKLHIMPSLLSEGKLMIDEDNSAIKQLEALIALRNRLLHNKETLEAFNLPNVGAEIKDGNLIIPESKKDLEFELMIKDNPIETISKELCIKFGKALGEFKKHIMDLALSDSFSTNKMVKECSW